MKDYWYPTAFSGWGDEEREAMQRVIASDRFTMGEQTEAFEAELAAFNQRKHAICVNSGSSANLLAVAALWDRDPRVWRTAVPALAWATTYAPFVQHGQHDLRLIDCDDTWCAPVSWAALPEDMIVTCSILGNPAPLDEIHLLVADYDEPWINDDCEALGASIGGKPTAAYGTIATQSFFWSHQLGAIEGGAVLTDDDNLAIMCRQLRDHGMDRTTRTLAVPFDKEYNFVHFGYNLRPVEMHMAIAREQLKKVAIHRTARRKNWNTFAKLAERVRIKLPPLAEGANPFGIHFEVMDGPVVRRDLAALLREAGVDCRLPTGGSFRLHPYGAPWADQKTPRADQIHKTGMFLGNAPYDISDKIERAVNIMIEAMGGD